MKKDESTGDLLAPLPLTPERVMTIFQPGGMKPLLEEIAAHARSMTHDATTPKGREAIKSVAYAVARTKTTIDDLGKSTVEDAKKKIAVVDAERKVARDFLDSLKAEIRQPVTEFEEREARRVQAHQAAITEIERAGQPTVGTALSQLRDRLGEVTLFDPASCEEFGQRAQEVKELARRRLEDAIAAEERAAHIEAEAAALRAENARLNEERLAMQQAIASSSSAAAAFFAPPPAAPVADVPPIIPETAPPPPPPPVAPVAAAQSVDKVKCHRETLQALVLLGIPEIGAKNVISAIIKGAVPHVHYSYES